MNKKLTLIAFLFLFISIAAVSVLMLEKKENGQPVPPAKDNPLPPDNASITDGKIILFYGDGCPHCLTIEAFLEEKNASQKINYETKEIWSNNTNKDLMMEKVNICKMDLGKIGVPFLWDGENGKCLMGPDQIKVFFQAKIDAAGKE